MLTIDFFVMIKPDGVKRGLVGEIISRFEKKGFELVDMRFMVPDIEIVKRHYAEQSVMTFFKKLVKFTCSGKVVLMKWNGNIQVAREHIVGDTIPWKAVKGTIRGDFTCSMPENLIHCSDSPESAIREIGLWFS